MGTRSLIRFEKDGKHLVDIYRQFDGYPSGRGKELIEFLIKGKIVNGIGGDAKFGVIFNGIEDLAAQWISYEKGHQVGNVYIQTRYTKKQFEESWIEYFYLVQQKDEHFFFTIKNPIKTILKSKDFQDLPLLLEAINKEAE